MSDKKWKPIGWFECPECRGELEGFTEAEDDFLYDGDIVRCTNCGWVGEIIVDSEAWVKEALNKIRQEAKAEHGEKQW